MGFIGGALNAFSGGPKGLRVIKGIKNREIDKYQTGLMDRYGASVKDGAGAMDAFKSLREESAPARESAYQNELGTLRSYYGSDPGSMESKLSGFRQQERDQGEREWLRGAEYAQGGFNRAKLMGGQPSSYLNSGLQNRLGDIRLGLNSQDLMRRRADENFLDQNRLGLIGRERGLLNEMDQESFVPINVGRREQSMDQGLLQQLIAIDNANRFYAPIEKKSGLQKWAAFANAADQGIMNVASIATNLLGAAMGGGGGGAAPSISQQQGQGSGLSLGYGGGGGQAPFYSQPSYAASPSLAYNGMGSGSASPTLDRYYGDYGGGSGGGLGGGGGLSLGGYR